MFELMPLPYAEDALEPYISAKAIQFHHGKHHRAYIDTLNRLVQGTAMSTTPLEEIIQNTAGRDAQRPIFNNAGQVWNHNFFWSCIRADGGRPNRAVEQWLAQDLGGIEVFKETFRNAAVACFGSGWAWLVLDVDGKLKVTTTSNADTPMVHGQTALLTCDVWEHAYYLDYQNRRGDFVSAFLDHLVNWDCVASTLGVQGVAREEA
jgi:superoxide dismutase, Fe-Mn family